MKRECRLILALLAPALGACHDSSDGDAVGFDPFVTNLIQNGTDDARDPVEVPGASFAFPQDENAFDDLLPPDGGAIVPQ